LALRWVKNNIAKFGGNCSSITIFGESAGAMSVAVHLTSPKSAGLYDKAIMESNPIVEYQNYSAALSIGENFTRSVGCQLNDLRCLQNLNSNKVLANTQESLTAWVPVIGGQELPDSPLKLFKQGRYNKVPTIIGTTGNEAAIFIPFLFPNNLSASSYESLVRNDYPDHNISQQVLELYPARENYDNRITYAQIATHQQWACPSAQIILAVNQYNPPGKGGYLYYLEHVPSFGSLLFGPVCGQTTCHAQDLFFVWNTLELTTNGDYNLTSQEATLALTIQEYWGQFSKTGVPSGPGQVQWPRYVRNSNTSLIFDIPASYTSSGHLQRYCNFWESLATKVAQADLFNPL